MDTLFADFCNLIPPQYLRFAITAMVVVKLLDELVRLIPDRWLAGHTTVEAVVQAVKRLAARLATVKLPKAGPPAALLLVLLLPSIALADQPAAEVRPLAPPAAAVQPLPPAAEAAVNAVPPPACPEPCAACGQKVSTVGPRSFWDGTGGKVLIGVFAAIGSGVTLLQSLQGAGVF